VDNFGDKFAASAVLQTVKMPRPRNGTNVAFTVTWNRTRWEGFT
jgi:hypothetical protein